MKIFNIEIKDETLPATYRERGNLWSWKGLRLCKMRMENGDNGALFIRLQGYYFKHRA